MKLNNRQKWIAGIFLLIIVATLITSLYAVKIDIELSAKNDDIFGSSMDVIIYMIIMMPIFIAEIDLLFSAVYFASDKSRRVRYKTIFNGATGVMSVGIIISIILLFCFSSDLVIPILIMSAIVGFCLPIKMVYLIIKLIQTKRI